MEEGGWIERRQDAADRRVRTIHPTPRAREAFAKVKELAIEVYEESLRGVPEETRRGLVAGLRAMAENLADGEQSSPCGAIEKSEGMAST
jgi:DNA-binding MarR family transcriptional regulator